MAFPLSLTWMSSLSEAVEEILPDEKKEAEEEKGCSSIISEAPPSSC